MVIRLIVVVDLVEGSGEPLNYDVVREAVIEHVQQQIDADMEIEDPNSDAVSRYSMNVQEAD